ncbi:hypothetical protein [Rubellicoccus peritrichatus]|uniref:Uncharacterized protein n=1 Tax=Rubellicoccus peritrichatus TaxID=3080537 RepID=A0AAQ3LAT1_9BACT|nr:hypothetical protein [Puniceicoccus sp. CR14]WOO41139.1 hypothetical protein RZN69_21165 [Puniceicoccus sp. CR14]
MKFLCTCGATICDGTDYLPYKAHMLPDVNYYDPFNIVDDMLDEIAAGRQISDADYMRLRQQFPRTRTMYQCRECGSVIIWNRDFSDRYVFNPEFEDTPHDLLDGTRKDLSTKAQEQRLPLRQDEA